MRNTRFGASRLLHAAASAALMLAGGLWVGGCVDANARQTLNKGYAELGAREYDEANAHADEFLRSHPNGSGVGEAYYLKGRIEEQKAQDPQISATLAEKREHLDAARDAYQQGISSGAPSNVRALLHSGIANVDYFEEDYTAALTEWNLAYDTIEDEPTKARVLYQIGRCQQRLGMFGRADQTFAHVQALYPETDSARWAANRSGATAFYVEVGLFPDVHNAERASQELRKSGFPSASHKAEAGRELVRVGPIPTYIDAKAIQTRVRGEFPGAIISP